VYSHLLAQDVAAEVMVELIVKGSAPCCARRSLWALSITSLTDCWRLCNAACLKTLTVSCTPLDPVSPWRKSGRKSRAFCGRARRSARGRTLPRWASTMEKDWGTNDTLRGRSRGGEGAQGSDEGKDIDEHGVETWGWW
jgi:hypothetical protein